PLVVILPSLLALLSMNQRSPSGPATIALRPAFAVGTGYVVGVPPDSGVRPIKLFVESTNHAAPSGPTVAPGTYPPDSGRGLDVIGGRSARAERDSRRAAIGRIRLMSILGREGRTRKERLSGCRVVGFSAIEHGD